MTTNNDNNMICNDVDCPQCGKRAELRSCASCGARGMVTDCGHRAQPRPISAGRTDGSDLQHDYCADCAAPDEIELREHGVA